MIYLRKNKFMEQLLPELLEIILNYCPNSTGSALKRTSKSMYVLYMKTMEVQEVHRKHTKKNIKILVKSGIRPQVLRRYLKARYHANAFAWALIYTARYEQIENVYWLSQVPENRQVLGSAFLNCNNPKILKYLLQELDPDRKYVFGIYKMRLKNNDKEIVRQKINLAYSL